MNGIAIDRHVVEREHTVPTTALLVPERSEERIKVLLVSSCSSDRARLTMALPPPGNDGESLRFSTDIDKNI